MRSFEYVSPGVLIDSLLWLEAHNRRNKKFIVVLRSSIGSVLDRITLCYFKFGVARRNKFPWRIFLCL